MLCDLLLRARTDGARIKGELLLVLTALHCIAAVASEAGVACVASEAAVATNASEVGVDGVAGEASEAGESGVASEAGIHVMSSVASLPNCTNGQCSALLSANSKSCINDEIPRSRSVLLMTTHI